MSILDVSLLIILAGFVINGLAKGIISLIGRILGLFIGVYVASNFHLAIFSWAQKAFNITGNEFIGKIVTFILVFIIATFLVDILIRILEKIFNLLAIIPGSKYLNNLAGAALGLLEGTLFLGLIIFIISHYIFLGSLFGLGEALGESLVVPFLLKIVDLVLPLLPAFFKTLGSLF